MQFFDSWAVRAHDELIGKDRRYALNRDEPRCGVQATGTFPELTKRTPKKGGRKK